MIGICESPDIFNSSNCFMHQHISKDKKHSQNNTIKSTLKGIPSYCYCLSAVCGHTAIINNLHNSISNNIFCNFWIISNN